MPGLKTAIFCALTAFGAAALPIAASEAAAPATQPATRPAAVDARALARQLGADSFQDRQAASEQLRKMGPDALPALKEATASNDPEVQARARGLIKELQDKEQKSPNADAAPAEVRVNGQNIRIMQGAVIVGNRNFHAHNMYMVSVHGNTRAATINDNGNVYTLSVDGDGLKMSVTEGGQTRKYEAKDADDLKKNNPEAYKIYEQRFGPNGDGPAGMGGIRITPAR